MIKRIRPASACDFPYYAGAPVRVSPAGWLLVLAGLGAGFAGLIGYNSVLPSASGRWIAVFLFVALPLGAMRIAARRDWRALFARVRWNDLWIGVAFVPVVLIASGVTAWIVTRTAPGTPNPAFEMLQAMDWQQRGLFFASTLPQLFGEELITILPFLAVLSALGTAGWPRGVAIICAWIVSALMFGALHLQTYGWHLGQALGVIFVARLILTLPYMITKSIWASTAAHVLNDWSGFLLVLALSGTRS